MKDDIGNRIKSYYEGITRYYLLRRTYTIIRLDGKAFRSFTRGLERPYDERLMKAMDETAKILCSEIQGVKMAYTQSDEISLLLTDFDKLTTNAWFDGNIQKMVSISASIATAYFNQLSKKFTDKIAFFDSRVFTIPDPVEVENYFIWRQKDCVRNSISMTAQSMFSHKELMNKNTDDMQEMCFQKGLNWNNMSDGFKRGRMVVKEYYQKNDALRSIWNIKPAIDFLKERENLSKIIPKK